MRSEASVKIASKMWQTVREGNGFNPRSIPSPSSSSCQPGKVDRSKIEIKISGTVENLAKKYQ